MSLKRRVLLVYAVILLAGASLSALVVMNSYAIVSGFAPLVRSKLPLLAAIHELEAETAQLRPLLYEYYASQDRDAFVRRLADNEASRQQGLRTVLALLGTTNGNVEQAARASDDLSRLSRELDVVLSVYGRGSVDWDEARRLLGSISERSGAANDALEAVARDARRDVSDGALSVEAQTRTTLWVVIVTSTVFLIAAGFAALAVHRFLEEAALRRRLALFVERNPGAVLRLNSQGQVESANPSALALAARLGVAPGEEVGLLPTVLPDAMASARAAPGSIIRLENEIRGVILGAALHYVPEFGVYHVYMNDITQERQAERRVEYLALHDELTGLPNRRQLEERLRQGALAHPQGGTSAMLYVDVQMLGGALEGLGNFAAGQLYAEVGSRLSSIAGSCGASTTVYRLEGGTYAILSDCVNAEALADAALAVADTAIDVADQKVFLTVAAGVAMRGAGEPAESIMSRASIALSEARREGPRTRKQYDEALARRIVDRASLLADLRDCELRDELKLQYQPKLCCATGTIHGAEALLRWHHPVRGLVSPADFVPLAESSLRILPIGRWVLQTAAVQAREWAAAGIGGFRVAVNVSARQFADPQFLQVVEDVMLQTGASAALLELEITESVAMQDIDRTVALLERLSDMGFHLAIDDFGTGFSSLSYLKQLPIDTLKLDRAFVSGLPDSARDRAIVGAMLDLARRLDVTVVAEGVETAAQLAWLRAHGCSQVQGYFVSRPVNAEAVPAFVERTAAALSDPLLRYGT